jgi:hypothetical protein
MVIGAAALLALPAAAQQKKADEKDAPGHEQKVERKDVPAAVLAAFAKAYPKATAKGFSREVAEGKTYYEIESLEGKIARDVTFSPDGTLVEVEEAMDFAALPRAVQDAFRAKYPNTRVELAEKKTKGGQVAYEIHFLVNGKEEEMVLDAAGKPSKV